MKDKNKRCGKIADLIKRELADLFTLYKYKLHDERLHDVYIVDVEISGGYASAEVFYFIESADDLKNIDALLQKAKGFLRHYVSQRVALRVVPELRFTYDASIKQGLHMQHLLDETLNEA